MKRLLGDKTSYRVFCILFLCFAVCSPFESAWAQGTVDDSFVSAGACDSPATTCTVYLKSAIPKGDVILVVASWGGATTTAAINDGHNAYNSIFGPLNAGQGANRGQAWITKNTPAGVSQATITLSAASSPQEILLWIIPLKGLDPKTPVDPNSTHTNTGTGTTMTTGSSDLPTAFPNEMVWGVFLEDNYSTIYAPGPGFTSVSGQEAVSLIEYKNVTQTGKQSALATNGRGSNNWIGAVFALKVAGQSGPSGL